MELEFGVSRCKLLYRGWISNKVLLCIAQGTVFNMVNHNGKTTKI